MLTPGITLDIRSDSFRPVDLAISPGVRPLPGTADAPAGASAVVPVDHWRPLRPEEHAVLTADGPVAAHETMRIVELDPSDLENCRRELLPLLAAVRDDDEPARRRRRAAVEFVREQVLATLQRRVGVVATARGPFDAVVHRPNRLSTAFNHEQRIFMGLHLDNHQDHALRERHLSYPLTVVNLGFRERYLHFVNLRVAAMIAMLEGAKRPVPETSHALKNAFFAQFARRPVLRVTLRPGQGYVVNTQDVLHDGATNTHGAPDVSFLTANLLSVPGSSPVGPR